MRRLLTIFFLFAVLIGPFFVASRAQAQIGGEQIIPATLPATAFVHGSNGQGFIYDSHANTFPLVYEAVLGAVGAVSTSNISSLSGTSTTIDGVSGAAGLIVLLTAQSTASQNGLWTEASGSWTRPSVYDTGTSVQPGAVVWAYQGTSNGTAWWYLSASSAVTVDTTSTTWSKLSGGGGGGSGTVTSVAESPTSFFTVSGSPITTSGTFTWGYATGLTSDENQVLAVNSSGAAGLYTLTPVMEGASPTNTYFLEDVAGTSTWMPSAGSGTVNSATSGQVAYYASTGSAVSGETTVTPAQTGASPSNGYLLEDVSGTNTWESLSSLGLLTGASGPSIISWSVSGTTLDGAYATGLSDYYVVGTNGSGAGGLYALTNSYLPNLAGDVTGNPGSNTVGKVQGITWSNATPSNNYIPYYSSGAGAWDFESLASLGGVTSITGPSILSWSLSSGTDTASYATGLTGNEYQVLGVNGSGAVGLGAVNLGQSAAITGTLPIGNGGTGQTSTPTDGQLLIGDSSTSGLTLNTITAGSGITVTNGHHTITIAASGGGATLPTNFIEGAVPAYVSTTEVEAGSGTAYVPNGSAAQTWTSPLTDAYSYSSQTDLTINASNNEEVSSASHSFTANDIGSTVDVTAGTSWTTGNYIILTVDGSGNAYLNKSPSAAGNSNKGTYTLKLTASVLYGMFLTSTPSLVIQAPLQFVDLAIDASNNELVSSASYTFTAADVGQYLDITAGTSWTVGYYLIASVSGGKATLASSPSAAGNSNKATASMSSIPYGGSAGNYQGTASESIDGNTNRYLGAFYANSSNQVTNFRDTTGGTSLRCFYQVNTGAAPFQVQTSAASETATSINCGAVVPPTSTELLAWALTTTTVASAFYIAFGNSNFAPGSGSGIVLLTIGAPSTDYEPRIPVDLVLNGYQAYQYYSSDSSSYTIDVNAYEYVDSR
jgi:hypothetical protein